MLTENSKSLREFYLTAKTKAGEILDISFGYDMSHLHSGFYIQAAVDFGWANTSKATLAKIESLKIPALTAVIAAVGTDVFGSYPNYVKDFKKAFFAYIRKPTKSGYADMLRLNGYGAKTEEIDLHYFIQSYKRTLKKDHRKASEVLREFLFRNSIRKLEQCKAVVTSIRQFVVNGALVNREAVNVNFGIIPVSRGTADSFNASYYKRDIDMIRRARMVIYKKFGKKYVPSTKEIE